MHHTILRNAADFRLKQACNNDIRGTIFYNELRLYNMAPNEVKNEVHVQFFKQNFVNIINIIALHHNYTKFYVNFYSISNII